MVAIYALCDPETGAIRYIGKANDAQKRLSSHLRDARRRKTPVACWVGSLAAKGTAPQMKVLAECGPSEWPALERQLIAEAMARGERLLNLAEGGNEPFCPPETRAANGRNAARKRVATPDARRVYELKRTVGQLLKAGHVPEGAKEKLRLAAALRPDLFGRWAGLK